MWRAMTNPGTVLLCKEMGSCRLFRCRACQEQQGHFSPCHQEGIPPEARHWGAGAMLTAAEGMAHPAL